MIIQCEKCKTKFRLDDSRVTDRGVKVRCTKCKYVFRVHQEEFEAEHLEHDGTLSGLSFSESQDGTVAATQEDQQFVEESALDVSFATEDFEEGSQLVESADLGSCEMPSFDLSAMTFETNDIPSGDLENAQTIVVEPAVKPAEVDFSSFDFGDGDSEPELTPSPIVMETVKSAPAPVPKVAPQGLDFSDDDMFGAVVPSAPEASSEPISFDFEGDSFAESMDMSGLDSKNKSSSLSSLDTFGEAPFNLGEIDFGDELTSVAVQQVNPEDLQPSQEILFAPLAEAQNKTADDDELVRSFLGDDFANAQQELPPLSIASRRKQSPLFSVLMAVVALLVLSVAGYFGFSALSVPKETASVEGGKISIRAVEATFIENGAAGELLVISGEALNEYPKPRAALQISATVYDGGGQSIASKSAYGGNPLTEEQLESLSLDKIEAAMANQFGDSLANMEVAPGKAIPFVIVLANIPRNAKDFSVQSAGSTVATGKQQ